MKNWQKILVSINLFLSFIFLKTELLLAQSTNPDPFLEDKPFFQSNIGSYVSTFIEIAMIIGALVCLAMLLLGGIGWITSSGDKNKLEQARGRITAAIIGIAILASVLVIWMIILRVFGLDNNFKVEGINLGGGGSGTGGGTVNVCNGGNKLANGCCDNVKVIYYDDDGDGKASKNVCSAGSSMDSKYWMDWSCCSGL